MMFYTVVSAIVIFWAGFAMGFMFKRHWQYQAGYIDGYKEAVKKVRR